MRAFPLVLATLLLAGCFGGSEDPRGGLVPYPRLGDVAVYEATGALVELARWENGVPFAAASAQVRFTIAQSADAIDAARAQHASFQLTTELAEAGVFDLRSERLVSVRHQAIVQSYHPLSQDQAIVAFDERGYPWLWGASALIGEELVEGARLPVMLPDNLGLGETRSLELVVGPDVRLDERDLTRVDLRGAGVNGTLYMEPGTPWPYRVTLALDEAAAPHLRSDGGFPVTLDARRVSLVPGNDPLPPRDRSASFGPDASALRSRWNREMPPDGDITAILYPLSEAARDAKLLDRALADWLAAADTPLLYRATFQEEPGELDGSTSAHWLLSWVSRDDRYYEVQVSRLHASGLPLGVPRIEATGPAQAPSNEDHGWFDPASVPESVVPISEGIRIMRDVFGAEQVQLFLRSFATPPGHSYFIDGGFDGTPMSAAETTRPAGGVGIEAGGVGRYTVVYNPNTGLLEHATGPATPRLASP